MNDISSNELLRYFAAVVSVVIRRRNQVQQVTLSIFHGLAKEQGWPA